jgi:hypothetical protein
MTPPPRRRLAPLPGIKCSTSGCWPGCKVFKIENLVPDWSLYRKDSNTWAIQAMEIGTAEALHVEGSA